MKSNYLKKIDNFWTVVFTDPISIRLTPFIARHTKITPNQISLLSLFVGLMAAVMFLKENLILGAILWQISYILDTADGKLARLLSQDSKKGDFVDMVTDGLGIVPCLLAIAMVLAKIYGIGGVFVILIFLGILLFNTNMTSFYSALKNSGGNHQIRKGFYFVKSKGLFRFYYKIEAIFAKYRIIPYPTSTDCEALIFVIGPIFATLWNPLILWAPIIACILMSIGTMVYSFKTYYFLNQVKK